MTSERELELLVVSTNSICLYSYSSRRLVGVVCLSLSPCVCVCVCVCVSAAVKMATARTEVPKEELAR